MKKRPWVIILLIIPWLLLPGEPVKDQKIVEVQFVGLKRTKPGYLRQFLTTAPGIKYDQHRILKDLQTLRNLQYFSEVGYKIEQTREGVIVRFNFKEVLTLLPIFNFGGIRENFWFQVGMQDSNFLGQGYSLGGYYRYYDRNSFNIFFTAPYLFSKSWGLALGVANHATLEPVFYDNWQAEFKVDRFELNLLLRHSLAREVYFELGLSYLSEVYNRELSSVDLGIPDRLVFNKFLVKLTSTLDFLNYYYHYVSGFSNSFSFETVKTEGEGDIFWKTINISRLFFRTGNRGNFALRLRAGLSINRDTPFVPFVLDSYITVRGSGNRVARGTAELTLNAEYRHTAWQPKWGALQLVCFFDWSAWRPAAGTLSQMFESENTVTFAGFGIRFYLKKFYNFIFRLDLGISITEKESSGIVIGAGQYF